MVWNPLAAMRLFRRNFVRANAVCSECCEFETCRSEIRQHGRSGAEVESMDTAILARMHLRLLIGKAAFRGIQGVVWAREFLASAMVARLSPKCW